MPINSTKSSTNNTNRCQHQSPSGRQCRTPLAPMHATLCARHAASQCDDSADLTALLAQNLTQRRSAEDIHAHLWNLSLALQQGRISPRRAVVLAYIHSLLLRTLPAIEQHTKPEDRKIIIDMPRPNHDDDDRRIVVDMPRPLRGPVIQERPQPLNILLTPDAPAPVTAEP
jgi:hypothetical protein